MSQVAPAATMAPAEMDDEPFPARVEESSKVTQVKALNRKLVYRAELDLAVEDFAAFINGLDAVLDKFDAFASNSSLAGLPDEPRRGQWQIRVPVDHFRGLVKSLERLGEVRRVQTSSDDVTAEFFDVEARIRNAQNEEARLLKLLDDRTATLDAVLSVEREIARVRGEIEQMQARVRVLSELSSLSTIELRVEELHGYAPEQSPSFAVRIERSFVSSMTALGRLLQGAGVVIALSLPWLIFWGAPVALAVLLLRRARRRRAAALGG